MGVSEFALIQRIAERTARRPGVALGIGDDAAVLDGTPATVLTQDLLVDGVHFRAETTPFTDLGHKALAVSLSDLAAMGARPVAALVGLGLPGHGVADGDVDEIYAGMEALAAEHALTIAGGDVTAAPALVLAVTAVGTMAQGVAPVCRDGARPGDLCCVTGALGASASGLELLRDPDLGSAPALVEAHRRPTPRLGAGQALAAGGAHAMLDCSDGLALDARRLALASACELTIDLAWVPVAEGVARVAAALGEEADLFAATRGEDYELVAAVAEADLPSLRAALHPLPLTVVGGFAAGAPGLRLERDGVEVIAPRLGWEHGA